GIARRIISMALTAAKTNAGLVSSVEIPGKDMTVFSGVLFAAPSSEEPLKLRKILADSSPQKIKKTNNRRKTNEQKAIVCSPYSFTYDEHARVLRQKGSRTGPRSRSSGG
ncbi:MAG: hypothetical protein J6Z24_05050, partial [Oscillospiraceae bacterium]|nr:hypothetical protein [Oscillospiraceae bacterium]